MQLLQPTLPPVSGLEALARRCQAEQRGAIILGSHQKELLATARICQLEGLASRCFIGGRSMHNFATSHDAVPAGYRHPLWEVDPRQTCFSTVDQRKEAIKFLYQGGVLGIFPDVEVPASKYNTEVISLFGIKRRISTFAFRLALKKEVAVYFFARRWRSDNRGYDYALELMPPFETAAQGAAAYQACLREVLVGQEHDYSAWWWLSQRYAGQDGHPLPHCELDESHFATGEFAPPQN
jgi:lauroyl/myristoyl acyltransferase